MIRDSVSAPFIDPARSSVPYVAIPPYFESIKLAGAQYIPALYNRIVMARPGGVKCAYRTSLYSYSYKAIYKYTYIYRSIHSFKELQCTRRVYSYTVSPALIVLSI